MSLEPYVYRAEIIGAYDGDTITVEVDLGFGVYHTMNLRLARIDAPEVVGAMRQLGLISRDVVREKFVGRTVLVKTFKDKKEKYGRFLADVYIDGVFDEEHCINDILVKNNLAVYKEY